MGGFGGTVGFRQPSSGGGGGPTVAAIPDPYATGSSPPLVFPDSYYAQALPANVPSWWGGGLLPAGNSAILVTNFLTTSTSPYSAVYANDVCPRYVKTAATATDWVNDTWTFNPGGRWDASPQGTYTVPVPAPNSAVPSGYVLGSNTDHEAAFWDETANDTFSFWGNTNTSGTTPALPPSSNTGQVIASNDTGYPGFGPGTLSALSSSTAACGLPYIAQNITWADFKSGSIDHMIFCTVGNPVGSNTPANPAPISDGVSSEPIASGGIPEGTIFTFPSSFSIASYTEAYFSGQGSNAPALAAQVIIAIKNYGMLVGDSSAGNGVGVALEAFQPWNLYNPTAFPQATPPYWMANYDNTPYGEGAFKGMPWSSMIALEPGSLLCPIMSDNNATTTAAMKAAQGYPNLTTATTSVTLSVATSLDDMVIVAGTCGNNSSALTGTAISGLGATWVKVYETAYEYNVSSGNFYTDFLFVGYGCAAGDTSITTTIIGPTSMTVSRFSRSVATNPIITSEVFTDYTGGTKSAFDTTAVTTTAAGQLVVGICHIGYTDITENALPAVSELNYGGTTWSTNNLNRHIINCNQPMTVFQNYIVPSGTGTANVSATMHINGYSGYGGYATCLLVLSE